MQTRIGEGAVYVLYARDVKQCYNIHETVYVVKKKEREKEWTQESNIKMRENVQFTSRN